VSTILLLADSAAVPALLWPGLADAAAAPPELITPSAAAACGGGDAALAPPKALVAEVGVVGVTAPREAERSPLLSPQQQAAQGVMHNS